MARGRWIGIVAGIIRLWIVAIMIDLTFGGDLWPVFGNAGSFLIELQGGQGMVRDIDILIWAQFSRRF